MDIIKCWGTKEDAERVAHKLKGRDIQVILHIAFMGCPNWMIRHNGKFLLVTDKIVKKDFENLLRKGFSL